MNVDWFNLHRETVTHPGMWDDTYLQELLNADHGPVPDKGNVVVIPGRYHAADIDAINQHIKQYDNVLIVVTADEANEFPADQLRHEAFNVWIQTLNPARFDQGFTAFPLGYPPSTKQWVAEAGIPAPDSWWFFSGQITHKRREEMWTAINDIPNGAGHATDGFTQGMDRRVYMERMARAKIIPCPSGPETQDTFRLWEALAAGAVPLADASTPQRVDDGFWAKLFTDPPFPIIRDWHRAPMVINEIVEGWPHIANKTQAWYTRYRRSWAAKLTDTMRDLTGVNESEQVTVLVPTSPIPEHPETSIIENTIQSIRDRFPAEDIRIMVDGVRPEQHRYTEAYQEYTRRLLWLAHNEWYNVQVTVHDTHKHQAWMCREELATVATPLLLYVEHDTPLYNDWPVTRLVRPLLDKTAYLVRLNHEHMLQPDHAHLLVGGDTTPLNGLPYRRTIQWSQRPHLARVDEYTRWLNDWFKPGERSMIEDRMHSVVQRFPWERFRIFLYTPEGNMQRSIHTDGRGEDPKWGNVDG